MRVESLPGMAVSGKGPGVSSKFPLCANNSHRPPSLSLQVLQVLQVLQKVGSASGSLTPCLNLGVEGAEIQ